MGHFVHDPSGEARWEDEAKDEVDEEDQRNRGGPGDPWRCTVAGAAFG